MQARHTHIQQWHLRTRKARKVAERSSFEFFECLSKFVSNNALNVPGVPEVLSCFVSRVPVCSRETRVLKFTRNPRPFKPYRHCQTPWQISRTNNTKIVWIAGRVKPFEGKTRKRRATPFCWFDTSSVALAPLRTFRRAGIHGLRFSKHAFREVPFRFRKGTAPGATLVLPDAPRTPKICPKKHTWYQPLRHICFQGSCCEVPPSVQRDRARDSARHVWKMQNGYRSVQIDYRQTLK